MTRRKKTGRKYTLISSKGEDDVAVSVRRETYPSGHNRTKHYVQVAVFNRRDLLDDEDSVALDIRTAALMSDPIYLSPKGARRLAEALKRQADTVEWLRKSDAALAKKAK